MQVLVYSRADCHLCDAVWAQLEDAQRRYGFQLDSVDIDSDPELARRYTDCVPVVTINGKVRFRGQLSPALLEKVLREETRKS